MGPMAHKIPDLLNNTNRAPPPRHFGREDITGLARMGSGER